MRSVHGYLSRRAQTLWPGSMVYSEDADDPRARWTMERPGLESLDLGRDFRDATQAIHALMDAERAARKAGD